MKTVHFSDIHAHNHKQYSKRLPNGRNSRFNDILKVFYQVRDLCITEKADACLFHGDLFHSRTSIDIDVHFATVQALMLIEEVCPLYLLVGNHDQYSRIGDIHSMEGIKAFATVIDKPQVLNIKGLRVGAHPFTTDVNELIRWLNEDMPEVDLGMIHQGCNGAHVGAFKVPIKAEINVTDLPIGKCKRFWMGHYHAAQVVASGCEGEVRYLGSPLQLDHNERNEDKWLYVMDWSSETLKMVPTHAPVFHWFKSAAELMSMLDTVDSTKDFVRVECTPEEGELIKQGMPRAEVIPIREQTLKRQRIDASEVKTDEDLISAYVEMSAPVGLDKGRLVEMAMGFLRGE